MNRSTQISPFLSEKLKVLSFIAISMVIYIHMFYAEGIDMRHLAAVQNFIGNGLCRIAVPLFFTISGYLFFLKINDGITTIFHKMRKRVKTLLIPYILANSFTFVFYAILNLIALKIPAIDRVVNFKVFDTIGSNIAEILEFIYVSPPIAFQLWFVRDLMLIVLFSPLIYICLRYLINNKYGNIIFFISEIILFITGIYNGYLATLAWFSLGGYIAMSPRFDISNINRRYCIPFTIAYMGFCVLHALNPLPESFARVIPIFGIPAVWLIYDAIAERKQILRKYSFRKIVDYTFFIYLIHEPVLNIFKKLPLLFDRSEITLIVSYLIIPPLFIVIAFCVGEGMKQSLPRLYSIYTGGR